MDKVYKQRKMIFPIITDETLKLPFFVTGVGSLENQHPCYRPNGLPIYHFLYSTAGKGRLKIDNKEYIISANMGFYFEPNVPHEYIAIEEPWTTWWIIFSGYATVNFGAVTKLGRSLVFHINDMDKLNQLYEDIYSVTEKGGLSATNEASINLYRFLIELEFCMGTEEQKTRHFRYTQLQSVLTYLENNFSSEISLAELADIAGVTEQHLCRIFRQELNMRPFEYLARCRLQKAKELLISPENHVLKEIASQVGFNDVSYFCSVFRQYEGMTANNFRKMLILGQPHK